VFPGAPGVSRRPDPGTATNVAQQFANPARRDLKAVCPPGRLRVLSMCWRAAVRLQAHDLDLLTLLWFSRAVRTVEAVSRIALQTIQQYRGSSPTA
jgi:hypothetical protein